ncbi:MAG TPA: TA system VapC family ribonuclease toxin [Thermoanaerobaculia bacterium]|nr:TA system VapC family ribonuclease toxin [Thermoanaerobaculia bacterium]
MRFVLADVNVWLATLVVEHPHHGLAIGWWRDELLPSEERIAFCRVTQLSLLRLLTNERVMGPQRKTIEEAWGLYGRIVSRRPVVFVSEPEGTETLLAEHCRLGGSSSGFWIDGYLAAFARAGGLGLVTFDRGFRRYRDLDLRLLGGA